MTRVLDTHGLLVFLEKEPGFEKIESLFVTAVEKDNYLLMTSVNFGEVYYIVLRECGQEKANEIENIIIIPQKLSFYCRQLIKRLQVNINYIFQLKFLEKYKYSFTEEEDQVY